MQPIAILPLLGPALVCYLVADVASSLHGFDLVALVIALVAVGLSLAGRFRASGAEDRAERQLPWLGLAAAVSLLRMLGEEPLRRSVEVAEALALAGLGVLVLDLALHVPDRIASVRVARAARTALHVLGGATGLASVLATLPPLGASAHVLVPARYEIASACFAALCVLGALAVRLARPRLGSSPDALAANAWGVLALAPAAILTVVLSVGVVPVGAAALLPLWAAGSAGALYFGHVLMVDPKKRLSASRVSRDSVAGATTVLIVATGVALADGLVPRAPLPLALWTAATLLLALGVFFAMRALARRLLAPYGGRLLDSLAQVEPELAGAQTFDELARVVLSGLRAASGSTHAQPLLYGFDPLFEARLDAAGAVHVRSQGLDEQLLARLSDAPGEILVRATLESLIVRNPRQRPLLDALREHDVLCVVPLVADGALEGVFFVPRGERTTPLTLEELDALYAHARWLSGLFTVFASRGRSEARAHAAKLESAAFASKIAQLQEETSRARDALALLHAGRARRAETPTLIAYSPAMRALLSQLRTLSVLDAPVLFWAEAGLPIEPIARFLHAAAQRPAEPFIVVDCAALRSEHAEVAIFGSAGAAHEDAGCLRAADSGCVLLLDIAALPRDVQRRLGVAIATGIARPSAGGLPYRIHARVVASSREALGALATEQRCEPELAKPFEPFTCRLPPLRECPEDFESHALLALDRACRKLAREPLGIEAEALTRLRALPWDGNIMELERVVERAVAAAREPRLLLADLERTSALEPQVSPLEASLEEVERRALTHALERAAGNKSEAARLLGIPRTTLLDKLRRHKLEDAATRDGPSAVN